MPMTKTPDTVPDTTPENWHGAAFVLISPDALERGLGRPVVDAFAHAGLEVERWAACEIGPSQIDAMHQEAVRQGGGDIYRIAELPRDLKDLVVARRACEELEWFAPDGSRWYVRPALV